MPSSVLEKIGKNASTAEITILDSGSEPEPQDQQRDQRHLRHHLQRDDQRFQRAFQKRRLGEHGAEQDAGERRDGKARRASRTA